MRRDSVGKGKKMQEKGNEKQKTKVFTGGRQWIRPEVVRAVVLEVLYASGAGLLGSAELLFGTYPLGLALLCGAERHTGAILLGLLASAVLYQKEPTVIICAYAAAAVIRIAVSLFLEGTEGDLTLPARLRNLLKRSMTPDPGLTLPSGGFRSVMRAIGREFSALFCERVRLRMATGAVCAFIVGLYGVIAGGFRYYDLFAALFLIVVTPAAVPVYSAALEGRRESGVIRLLSIGALLFSLIWAARGFLIGAVSPALPLALFFTLTVTHRSGVIRGGAVGILCGIAYDPLLAPAFLSAALAFAWLDRMRRPFGGAFLACVAALSWDVTVCGADVLLTDTPAFLAAGTVFSLWVGWVRLRERAESTGGDTADRGLSLTSDRHEDSNERFRGISDAFSSLSEVFYNLSDRFRRPGTLDLRRICDTSFDAFCTDCPNKTVCWGLEYSETVASVSQLISQLHTKGKVTPGQIPEALARRCASADRILDSINRECAHLTGDLLRDNRTEILAMDYGAASEIINDALEEDDGEYRFDPETEKRVAEYLRDADVKVRSVTVYGKRRRRILLRDADVEQSKVTFETLRCDLGELCGMELAKPVFEVDGGVSTMVLQAKKKISVTGARNNISADGGISGDSINLFGNKKDYFYALISDGMGAGKTAAMTSGLCSVFLEKMLRAGNRAGTSLRMLNNMVCSRTADSSRECSSTVDLLELDLMTAEGSFHKSGAAPSFIVRGGIVNRVQSGTAPIGILRALDSQSTPYSFRPGDLVVLISDGIQQDDPECEWLTSYLSSLSGETPEQITYSICAHAAGSERHDDCSAVALRIDPAEED